MTPPEGPPTCVALYFLPLGMPPPISNTILPRLVPSGTSTRPTLFTLPTRLKDLVPLLFSLPTLANQSAPSRSIRGRIDHVSTLLMAVGLPKRPFSAGNGGLCLGMPRFPSIEINRAVSSPQTKAPAPGKMSRLNSRSVPSIFLPSKP